MRDLFFQLIDEYKANVNTAVLKLNNKSKETPHFFDESIGYLDENHLVSYEFHGYGCSVIFENGLFVDFDFGENGRCDGYKFWNLDTFIRYNLEINSKFLGYNNYEKIKNTTNIFVEKGDIIKAEDKDIFYLSEDFNNQNPIYWTPLG